MPSGWAVTEERNRKMETRGVLSVFLKEFRQVRQWGWKERKQKLLIYIHSERFSVTHMKILISFYVAYPCGIMALRSQGLGTHLVQMLQTQMPTGGLVSTSLSLEKQRLHTQAQGSSCVWKYGLHVPQVPKFWRETGNPLNSQLHMGLDFHLTF